MPKQRKEKKAGSEDGLKANMKINVRKLIEKISKYDYISVGYLVSAAEELETLERTDREMKEARKAKDNETE